MVSKISLKWIFSPCTKEVTFMDMTMTIQEDGTFLTRIYAKPLVIYPYFLPHKSTPEKAHQPHLCGGSTYPAPEDATEKPSFSACESSTATITAQLSPSFLKKSKNIRLNTCTREKHTGTSSSSRRRWMSSAKSAFIFHTILKTAVYSNPEPLVGHILP